MRLRAAIMTRIGKTYAALLASPKITLSFRDFERLLGAFGFTLARTVGSHRHYVHPDVPEILTVLPDGKHVKPYLVRRFLELVDRHGLSM